MKGKKKGGASLDTGALDGVTDGTTVPDDTPSNPGSPSGGGTKVPKGTGAGGGSWNPGTLGPKSFWISPDCRNVVVGAEWYEKVLVPAILAAFKKGADIQLALKATPGQVEAGEPVSVGGFTADLYSMLAIALGFREWNTSPVGDPIKDTKYAEKPPGSCILEAPMFHVGDTYEHIGPIGGYRIAPGSQAAFNQALEAFFMKFPQLGMWLYGLQETMVRDERFPVQSREISSLFDLSFLTKSTAGSKGAPPEKAPSLKVMDLFSLAEINSWFTKAQAWVQKWNSAHPAAVNEYKSFIIDWWQQATNSGKTLPVSTSSTPEQASKAESPATIGIIVGRLMSAPEGGPEIPVPVSGASVTIDNKTYTTSAQGYFEATASAGWHPVEIGVGPKIMTAYIMVEAGQTTMVDFVAP